MGLLDWFKRRKKKSGEEKASPDTEKEVLERTRKLQTEIEEHIKEKPKRKAKKERKQVQAPRKEKEK